MQKYKTIVIDPPWKYGVWGKASVPNYIGHKPESSNLPYESMTIQEIKNLPIKNISDDNCDLYLWTTQKYLPFSFEIIATWQFKYCQILTWCKKPMGAGQGGLFCPTTEFIILARKGKMPLEKKRIDTTWWNWPRSWKKHSRKPELFQDIIEKVSNSPRVELFARRERCGWDVWGNEVNSSIELDKIMRGLNVN